MKTEGQELDILLEQHRHDVYSFQECAKGGEDTGGISIHNIGGVFIVIFGGVFLVFVSLAIEYKYYRFKNKKFPTRKAGGKVADSSTMKVGEYDKKGNK